MVKRTERPTSGSGDQGGFTVIEVMISLTILLIGIVGLLSMQLSAMRATSFSRHMTEASVIAEDKMEFLRTMPLETILATPLLEDDVDAQGVPEAGGYYHWKATSAGVDEGGLITIEVSWKEQGGDTFKVTLETVRD